MALMLIMSMIDLPISIYRQFWLEERFGFNRMTAKLFMIDLIKGSVLGAAIGLPLIAVMLWLMQIGRRELVVMGLVLLDRIQFGGSGALPNRDCAAYSTNLFRSRPAQCANELNNF